MNFDDICQQHLTWVICISSNSLSQPVFVIWLTDSTDQDQDKFVVNQQNKIIASEDYETLLEVTLKVKPTLPDPVNTLTWLNKVCEMDCSSTLFELEVLEDSIQTRTFNKRTITEAINFINLCGDFDEQTGDLEIRTLRNKPNIRQLWEYGYNEIIWKEIGSNEQDEPVRLPELRANSGQLSNEMQQLITAFLNRLDIAKVKAGNKR
ncbi:hypothetical protein [Marinoscillum furvescens]|uniref:Uncharacterized protein n=1 Tax=Marinoscillum furvescens DSM 4134 TaxID=1122208 RepID=A0A3D9L023_MARFU|nr:hypothetical protein [Marinoscillum furvescens]RED93001.1 hypothetical protein C7460_12725 [Marinoscillum furvescens DSM 4134]